MKTIKQPIKKYFTAIFLFILSMFISSCNNINNLDDIIENNTLYNNIATIPVSDSIFIGTDFTDWSNIPVMLSDAKENFPSGDINEFKIAINSSRTQLYFYFKTFTTITLTTETYVTILSNDLVCDGKRISLGQNSNLWYLCDNITPIIGIGGTYSMSNQVEGSLDLSTYGSLLPQNERIYLSVYSVSSMSSVYPENDIVPGKWIIFKP